MVNTAQYLPMDAEISQRERFLIHLYRLSDDPPPLASEWKNCLPQQ